MKGELPWGDADNPGTTHVTPTTQGTTHVCSGAGCFREHAMRCVQGADLQHGVINVGPVLCNHFLHVLPRLQNGQQRFRLPA